MKNINLLYHPEIKKRRETQKILGCIMLACLIPVMMTNFALSFVKTEILTITQRIATLEKESALISQNNRNPNDATLKQKIKNKILDFENIANTIPEKMLLLNLKNKGNLLILQGRAVDASMVMTWAEILKAKMPYYEIKINAIKKPKVTDKFFEFELQLDKK